MGLPVRVRGLSKQLGGTLAVDRLDFDAPPGAVTALVGPPDAGIALVLRMLLGLVAPTAGTATIGDLRYAELPEPARTVGAVLGGPSTHPARSPLAHLRMLAAASGIPDRRVRDLLELTGLSAVADRPLRTLPAGSTSRTELAAALLGDPGVLLLDAPAGRFDPAGIGWISGYLRGFADRGGTVVVTGSSLHELGRTPDRLVVLDRGACVYRGAIADLRRDHPDRVVVAGSDPARLAIALAAEALTDAFVLPDGRLAVGGADPARIATIAGNARVAVHGMAPAPADLDQVCRTLIESGARC